MISDSNLAAIRTELFYGSSDYTKNQPDLFVPHRFQMLAPSQVKGYLESVKSALTSSEILIYIHIPFCFSECLFCNSFPLKSDPQLQSQYLQALLKEIDLMAAAGIFAGKTAKCIYFGGGTPTIFPNRDIKQILERIRSVIPLAEGCSITTEAHPVTITSKERLKGLAEAGVNRISMGCQTFDPDILSLCNRNNSEEQIGAVVKAAHEFGISVNIDMMAGLPGQSMESLERDLLALERVKPDAVEYIRHEIVNPLIVDLYKEKPELVVSDDTLFNMVLTAQRWMKGAGYEQNGSYTNDRQWAYRYYWLQELPIIAFGVRTRSYTTTLCYDKHEDLSTYVRMTDKGIPPIGRHIVLTKREQMFRTLMLNIQLAKGLEVGLFKTRYEVDPFAVFADLFNKLKRLGCLEEATDFVRLSEFGALFVEDVCDCIIDEALKEDSGGATRMPHSEGSRSVRL
ncbi:MAG: coproporphyrinogen III oxidase family protein [Geobacteraceae bacterium]|nr:coproporphyrinogen III oxidase family protein [Geobacteraceae bacterium]